MEVTFTDFTSNVPIKEQYEYVVDYISHTFDLEAEGALYLIEQLKNNRSSVRIYAEAIADFHIYNDVLNVQIDGDGFWFAENLDLKTAEKIVRLIFDGCAYLGQYLPGTTKEWEAYTL